jgi:nickel-type superoxide dismutase maturation protease
MRLALRSFEVTGESMLPALRPGDRLLVRTGARVRIGDVVVARHPARPGRLIVKRAVHRTESGWWLESDNQRAPGRQDSWDFEAVPDRLIVGRAVVRYRPQSRLPISASALSSRRAR